MESHTREGVGGWSSQSKETGHEGEYSEIEIVIDSRLGAGDLAWRYMD